MTYAAKCYGDMTSRDPVMIKKTSPTIRWADNRRSVGAEGYATGHVVLFCDEESPWCLGYDE